MQTHLWKSFAWLSLLTLLLLALTVPDSARGEPIEVKDVLLKLIERVDTPARDTGMLTELRVAEGQFVKEGELLGKIEDEELKLLKQKTELDLRIAEKKALDDSAVRSASEEIEVAEGDFKRAQRSRERLASSVPDTEFEHLKLKLAQAKIQREKAQHEWEVTQLIRDARTAEISVIEFNLLKRQIVAPFAGQVVEVLKRRGEWVEPGDKVVRIVRLDRLRAEGFLAVQLARPDLVGRPVKLKVEGLKGGAKELAGKLVFVSPEVDPVNRQARVMAEVDNQGQLLPAGLRATMVIQAP